MNHRANEPLTRNAARPAKEENMTGSTSLRTALTLALALTALGASMDAEAAERRVLDEFLMADW